MVLIMACSAAACGFPTVVGGASIQRGGYAKQGPVADGDCMRKTIDWLR
jgi:hypothetical protein